MKMEHGKKEHTEDKRAWCGRSRLPAGGEVQQGLLGWRLCTLSSLLLLLDYLLTMYTVQQYVFFFLTFGIS